MRFRFDDGGLKSLINQGVCISVSRDQFAIPHGVAPASRSDPNQRMMHGCLLSIAHETALDSHIYLPEAE